MEERSGGGGVFHSGGDVFHSGPHSGHRSGLHCGHHLLILSWNQILSWKQILG